MSKKTCRFFGWEREDDYLVAISKYKDESSRIQSAREQVEKIESFMKNKCTVVPITDEQKYSFLR